MELSRIKKINKELLKVISDSEDIYIIGHKTADFDSIGASIGLARLCKQFKDEVYVIVSDTDEKLDSGLKTIINDSRENYNILRKFQLQNKKISSNSTLFVVDTNKEYLIDLENCSNVFKNIVVIDHHNIGSGSINTEYSYIDTNSSSACEIVTQLLQFNKVLYDSNVATYLLAGIMLDTKRYIKNTTSKTMDTAEKLLTKGANYNKINDLFLVDFEQDRIINDLIFNNTAFETYDYNIPRNVSYTFNIYNDKATYRREDLGRAADKMLKYKVDAVFVFGQIDENNISISARSKSDVNVGLIMEQLGGGGNHQNAGCQIQGSNIMEIYALLRETVKTNLQFPDITKDPSVSNFQYVKTIKKD